MPCGWEAPDCIHEHWLPKLGGWPEPATSRAPCPLCGSHRSLSIWVQGKSVRWGNHCECDKDDVRAKLAAILPGCISARYAPRHAAARELIGLAEDRSLPELALRVALFELAGIGINAACDRLGISRAQRYRIVTQLLARKAALAVSPLRHHRRSRGVSRV